MFSKSIRLYEVRYYDEQGRSNQINLNKGKPALIEAWSIEEAFQIAVSRANKKVDYTVASIEFIGIKE
jgi:hypothetical protein